MILSRRGFTNGILGLAGSVVCGAAEPVRPHLQFPSGARERLAVTSYPFRAYIESPTNDGRDPKVHGMDMKDFPQFVADKFGVFNVNPLGSHFSSLEPAYLEAFRKALDRAKSHIVDLGLGGRDFSDSDAGVRDEAIAFGRKWIDIARTVGSPSVRQHLSAKPGTPPSVERTAEALKVLADYGARQNVVINLENDAPGAEDPFFIVRVLRKANHPFLRALPDFGNSVRGHDRKYNETAVNAMFKFAFNMSHVKSVLQDKGGKRDTVDLAPLFAIARANSYRGYFSMEFDTAIGDPVAGTKELVEQSLRFLA